MSLDAGRSGKEGVGGEGRGKSGSCKVELGKRRGVQGKKRICQGWGKEGRGGRRSEVNKGGQKVGEGMKSKKGEGRKKEMGKKSKHAGKRLKQVIEERIT